MPRIDLLSQVGRLPGGAAAREPAGTRAWSCGPAAGLTGCYRQSQRRPGDRAVHGAWCRSLRFPVRPYAFLVIRK